MIRVSILPTMYPSEMAILSIIRNIQIHVFSEIKRGILGILTNEFVDEKEEFNQCVNAKIVRSQVQKHLKS